MRLYRQIHYIPLQIRLYITCSSMQNHYLLIAWNINIITQKSGSMTPSRLSTRHFEIRELDQFF